MCNVHSARALHVHYATHHQMQCTIELRTLNFISVPNLVSLAQKFLEPEDPSQIKFCGPGACTLHPTRTATGKAYRLGQYTCDLQVWDRWCTSSCLQWRQKKKRCKTLARALHVHSELQPIKSYGAKYTMPRSTHLPSLVSLAQNFLALEDPTSKKFSDPGACGLNPTGTTTTKAHTLGLYTCNLQIWGRWGLPFGLQSWLKVCASLLAAARATCHVRRAPLKSTKSRVRRLGLSTLKIWCECTAPFSRQTPESSIHRQKGGREGGATTENANLSPQYKSPEYKEPSYAKAYELSFSFLRFWINHTFFTAPGAQSLGSYERGRRPSEFY